uniref:ubiquitin-conjugating enzyme E2 J2 isoform X7 n=1 Tax=Callithrix jacchus TaxID=9483 RepID=UPI00159D865E|nr:ubiquitin-conjugating enzyme E2 J2 isoform X7 [Callithrix jacchus]
MSSTSTKRAPTTATQRLKQDYLRIKKDPVPYICAEPLPSNILEWHYVVRGPEMTPYEGGYYHGKLIFPREFPFKPPSIYMITPNGRFKCNTRLCLSITDFHPDTWNPAWSVSTILTGLLSFMVEKGPTLGSIETSDFTQAGLGGVPALTPAPSWRLLCFGLPRHTQPRVPLCLSVSLLSESSLIHTHQGLRLGILGKDSWQHRVQRLI